MVGLAAVLWNASGCEVESAPHRSGPKTARWQRLESLRALRDRVRHPADGAGHAWLERTTGQLAYAISATPDHFEIVFEAGPLGVARGGSILFQLPQIGGWSIPQTDRPDARGYTEIDTTAADLEFDLRASSQPGGPKSLAIRVTGRPMRAGERVRIHYGAGPGLALPDRYAEGEARFWIGVDGDGDGSYSYLIDSPAIEVRAGPPTQLLASVSSTAAPGEPARVTLSLIDAHRNAATASSGKIELHSVPAGLQFPSRVTLETGLAHFEVLTVEPGVYRIVAAVGRFRAVSNPLVVRADATPIFWGDLHGHSGLSDGTGSPDEYFRYARDTAGLDVVALTDHDHLGALRLDESPERWALIRRATQAFNRPGRFVTLLGFEWTNWIYGHRHVLYFDGRGELLSAMDPSFETPVLLWSALRHARASALTFAHHSAGGPIATDWSIPPDPHFEPVTEITSIHGSSEAPDAAIVIKNSVTGNFVRDALDRGYRLGFVGSGDTHDGHPGITQVGYASGGLAAIAAERLTREGILEALRARRVYATSGSRIVLQAHLNGQPMGSIFDLAEADSANGRLRVSVIGTGPIARVDLVGSAGLIESIPGGSSAVVDFERTDLEMRPGQYLYIRVVQSDDATAWSSPFFFAAR
ncbi:MAG: CehA/McbA family metallohydrolase [Myxococcota bacterium]